MIRTINDLPDELISRLVSEDCLAAADLFSLVVTSKRFSRIAKPWLYHTIDSRTPRRKRYPGRGLFPVIGDLLQTLVHHPNLGLYVKEMKLAYWAGTLRGGHYLEDEYMPVIQAAQQTRLFPTESLEDLKSGVIDAEVLLILCFTPNLIELEMTNGDWGLFFSLEQLRAATLKPTTTAFHGFPKLRHVKASGIVSSSEYGQRYGDGGLDVDAVTFFLRLPAMQSFTAVAADLDGDHIIVEEDYFTHRDIQTDCPAGTSSVETMTFESCLLPCFTLSNPIRACKALKSFTCRWARGPHFFRLHFQDLHDALSCHKLWLERLILDVQEVEYVEFEPELNNIPIGDDPHEYARLSSLRDFEALTSLEVSVVILLGNLETPSLGDLLPPRLETLQLLAPTQWDRISTLQRSLMVLAQSCRRTLPRLRAINVEDLDVGLLGLEGVLGAFSAADIEVVGMRKQDGSPY